MLLRAAGRPTDTRRNNFFGVPYARCCTRLDGRCQGPLPASGCEVEGLSYHGGPCFLQCGWTFDLGDFLMQRESEKRPMVPHVIFSRHRMVINKTRLSFLSNAEELHRGEALPKVVLVKGFMKPSLFASGLSTLLQPTFREYLERCEDVCSVRNHTFAALQKMPLGCHAMKREACLNGINEGVVVGEANFL